MATAAKAFVDVDEYLHSSYHPDCDLVEGELQERNLGEKEHGLLQLAVGIWFFQHIQTWSLTPIPEMRIKIRPKRYRIADLAVIRKDAPNESILATPPLLVIEILSPEDRVSRYKERIADYMEMGIQNIWVLDPMKREAFDCSSGNWIQTQRLEVPGTAIYLVLEELPQL
jgi:Uma2 family endonuclease